MSSPCCAAGRPSSGTRSPKPRQKKKRRKSSARTSVADAVTIPEGTFLMGTADEVGFPEDGEGPVREVRVGAFRIDAAAVTNASTAAGACPSVKVSARPPTRSCRSAARP